MAKLKHNEKLMTASRAIGQSRITFIGLAVFSLFINLLMLTGPLYMLQVYDRILTSGSIPTLVGLSILVVVLYTTMALLDWCRASLFAVAASNIEDRLSRPAMEAAYTQNRKLPGRTSDQSLRELRTVRRFISSPALTAIFDLPFVPLFFAVLFIMHIYYGIWAVAGASVLIVIALLNQAFNDRSVRRADEHEAEAAQLAQEVLRHTETLDALGMKERMVNRWQEKYGASDDALTGTGQSLGGFTALTKAFRLLLQSGILGLGAWLSIEQQSTPGAMIAASIILGRAIAPLEQIVGHWRNITVARTAWRSFKTGLETRRAPQKSLTLPALRGQVRFEGVTAGPPGKSAPFLKDVSLWLEPGECLGVIGPSASGKSTFVRVLIGLWPAMIGTVRLDGADVNTIPQDRLGAQTGYLPQQVELFAGTIAENISRFEDEIDDDAVLKAALAAGCHEAILQLPEGYDTEIGEAGTFLSAGQRQRVGLARALYGQPNLVVLDEPNSNLDGAGDAALQSAIKSLKDRGATVVIVAHRPNAIAHCTKLLVMDHGRASLFGDRDEILGELSKQVTSGQVKAIRGES